MTYWINVWIALAVGFILGAAWCATKTHDKIIDYEETIKALREQNERPR